MILGIDLSKQYAQISVYNKKENTVDTPVLSECDGEDIIPVQICKKKGTNEWYVGDEAKRLELLGEGVVVDGLIDKVYDNSPLFVDGVSILPVELLEKYISGIVSLSGNVREIESVCVCLEEFNAALLDSLSRVFEIMQINYNKVEFINRNESDMYYVLSQSKDIWYGDVAIFDYRQSGLVVSMLGIRRGNGAELVTVTDNDFSEMLPYIYADTKEKQDNVNHMLTDIAEKLFEKRVVSSVFLTGKGFAGDGGYDDFIKFICNKRRVFIGQNIYSKGACYAALELENPKGISDRVLFCKDKLMYELDLDITERGKASRLRIVKPGTNWYKARKKYDFFMDGEREIVLHKRKYGEKEEETITISLEEFPVRPNKATKICIGFDFEADGICKVTVKDRGFGRFFKGCDKIIYKEF